MDTNETMERAEYIYEMDDEENVTDGVVTAVGNATEMSMTEMTPLHESVDVDALNDLFSDNHDGSSRNQGRVRFTYCGCRIHILSTGRVLVEPDGN
ncbi:HalOD1 output domain-containing protein [Haladaptatus pallidirubidus]|uniref:Halobacterial output domain-containing protein n=1 Tax=Haladaptatus pallidirubidus TaxID=1008152 RepID=A0AAV3UBI4_9EURY|nr:HalOD1 output domain-containing protein [Haladaptatus pallidirubidus]